jgi:hypothetical protein
MKKIFLGTLLGIMISGSVFAAPSNLFNDIDYEVWFYNSLANLVNNNIISGYPDGTFRPSNSVNRAELATIIDRTLLHERAKDFVTALFIWQDKRHWNGEGQEVYINDIPIIVSDMNCPSDNLMVAEDAIDEVTNLFADARYVNSHRWEYDCLSMLHSDLFYGSFSSCVSYIDAQFSMKEMPDSTANCEEY